ncbi:hypothetical protein JCM10369A_43230 [Nocardioides pyridinolyticus]
MTCDYDLLPTHAPAPLVSVQDGHLHTLAFVAGARGDQIRCLGVTEFRQPSSVEDADALHGLDAISIVEAVFSGTPTSRPDLGWTRQSESDCRTREPYPERDKTAMRSQSWHG